MQHATAIAAKAVIPLQPPRAASKEPESYKNASTTWLAAVASGIFMLLAAFSIAMLAVKKAGDGSQLMLEWSLLAGPGGAKVWLLSDLLRASHNIWPLLSVACYMLGVLGVMWPERVGIMGLAGLGRLLAAIMAVATMVFAILCIRAGEDSQRLAAIGYYDVLPWLIFFDMAAMVLVNMRIAGVAHRGGFHRLAKCTGAMMVAQVIAMLMLLASLNVFHDAAGLTWAAAGIYAFGGAGVTLVSLFLVLALCWNLIFRPHPVKLDA